MLMRLTRVTITKSSEFRGYICKLDILSFESSSYHVYSKKYYKNIVEEEIVAYNATKWAIKYEYLVEITCNIFFLTTV